MTVDEPVGAQAARTGRRPAELGDTDEQITGAHVVTELTGRPGTVHDPCDERVDPYTRGLQVGVMLVEGAGEHRTQRTDPLRGGRVRESLQRLEGVPGLG